MRTWGSRISLVLPAAYVLAASALFLYSYTQVDLSMTLSEYSIWQTIQKSFQYVGYYQRPLSAVLYLAIVSVFFLLYFMTLRLIRAGTVSVRGLGTIIIPVTLIAAFSYPALSYDIFNYMFTAKTVLVYGQSPYAVKPLDFTGVEPWLSFLRWTHLVSAYTPLWILISLVPYLLGFSTFLLIMWNMKLMLGFSYLVSAYLIYRILAVVRPKDALYGTALFALNPLVIIESVASPHNDIVMSALALLSMFLFISRRKILSYLSLAMSVALKLMTIVLYPVAFLGWNRKWALIAMAGAVAAGFYRKELLPWYMLWVLPFVALNPEIEAAQILAAGVSAGLLFRYAPVLYFGHYDDPVGHFQSLAFAVPVAAAFIFIAARAVLRRTAAESRS